MFYVHKREKKRNVFEMSNGLTGSSVMEFWIELALEGTTDGIGALCCSGGTGNREGKMHMQSYIKN